MKKILFIISVILLAGCSDLLDQMPSDKLPTSAAITTVSDLQLAVNGVYVLFTQKESYSGDYGLYADGKSGDTKFMASFNWFSPIIRYQHDATSDESLDFYSLIYTALARVNNILEVTDDIVVETGEEDAYNDMVGQLYALRAFLHFDAARLFAQLPSVAADMNAANSGIVLAKQYYQPDATFTRSTLKETYDFIKADFETALAKLSKEPNYGKINYWAAKAILSRVYLYLEDNNNALAAAIEVINNNAGYRLYERSEYLSVWSKTATVESLFEIITTDNVNADRNSIGYYTIPSGYCECAATDDFAAWLRSDLNDVRSDIVAQMSDNGDYLAWWPQKYLGQEGASAPSYVNNPKIIRLSEVYLIAAEARVKGGNATGALSAVDYYNDLREKRITGYVDAATVTLNDILDERRRELFCENSRFFDLVRNKININAPIVQFDPVSYTDYRVICAIPQRELDISPDLEQNPGY
jgi:starch-binding outer membrane protein, SusD/RagB family